MRTQYELRNVIRTNSHRRRSHFHRPARYIGRVALTAGFGEYSLHQTLIESPSTRTTGCFARPYSVLASDRFSNRCPMVFDNATPTSGTSLFGSSYATTTRSPADATLVLEGFSPNTIGTAA